VNTVRTPRPSDRPAGGRRPPAQVWERQFLGPTERASQYYEKQQLELPARVRETAGGAGYRLVLSRETPIPFFPTDDAQNVRFRVKNRVSFTAPSDAAGGLAAALAGWRVDVTFVRELIGTQSAALPGAVEAAFRFNEAAPQTPANLLQSLGLAGAPGQPPSPAQLANRLLYKYELEVEHVLEAAEAAERLTTASVKAAVSALLELADPTVRLRARIQELLATVAAHVVASPPLLQRYASGELGLKDLTPQAVAPTRAQYAEIYPPVGYYLTDKPDGVHALAVVRDGHLLLAAPGVTPPLQEYAASPAPAAVQDLTVVDGELVAGAAGEPSTFYAFDVIVLRGDTVAALGFEERQGRIHPAVEVLRHFASFRCAPKPFVHLESSDPEVLAGQLRELDARPRPYRSDGRILYAPGEAYADTKIYKVKPFEENTFDFYARRAPDSVLGRTPFVALPGHELYFLFVGAGAALQSRLSLGLCPGYGDLFPGRRAPARPGGGLSPVPFQPPDQPYAYLYQHPSPPPSGAPADLDGRVVELRLSSPEGADGTAAPAPDGGGTRRSRAPAWEFVRLRPDREEDLRLGRAYGNAYLTAEGNWHNCRVPLTDRMLSHGPVGGYFAGDKAGIYTATTAFVSFAKTQLLAETTAGQPCVVDLGAGKGQDLGRYRQVSTLIAVDSSPEALAELARRRHQRGRRRPPSKGPRVHTLRADFNDPHEAVAARVRDFPDFPAEGADAVVCNLAAHYAFGTTENVANFVLLVRGLLRPGGQAVFTLLDGQRVLDLLAAAGATGAGQSWDAREGGALKYSVRRQFGGSKLTAAGQKIEVLLPFSRGELYPEFLSNIDALCTAFTRRGFAVRRRRGLWEEYGERFRDQRHFDALTADDKKWLSLFVSVQFERLK